MTKKKSISFSVNDELENYLNELSEKMGINRSSVITMIINQYRQGMQTVDALNKAMKMIEKKDEES